jgi:hypothetical protein
MRLTCWIAAAAGLALSLSAVPGLAHPQDTAVLAPDASAAKAREIIQRAIQAMGGDAYLGVKDFTRTGRYSSFDHSGAARGTVKIIDMVKLPDKECIEYDVKIDYGVDAPIPLIFVDIPYPLGKSTRSFQVRNGDEGWIVNSGGVVAMEQEALTRMRRARKKDIDLVFRTRLNDPNLVFRYTGQDTMDLKWVDGVEIADASQFITRIAFDHSTHLPVSAAFRYRDPDYDNQPTEDRDVYTLYHTVQGVVTPFQIAREHNGYRTSQMFYEEVKYNTGLSDAMFTRQGVEELRSHSGKSKKSKD